MASCDWWGCGPLGRRRGCRGWQPVAAGWPVDSPPEAVGPSPRPGPTRGRRCGRKGAQEDGEPKPRSAGCPCSHLRRWQDPVGNLREHMRAEAYCMFS